MRASSERIRGWALLAVILLLGVGIRLYDLTDWPLDFHPTRQYRGLLLSRMLYLRAWKQHHYLTPEQQVAFQAGYRVALHEPLILETLVARTYLVLGREYPWIVRLYDLAFWLIGALGLGLLARRMAGGVGGLVALAYWFLLPFAIAASRAFQPDPLMVSLLPWIAYGWYRWAEDGRWRWVAWAALAGLIAGIVKVHAVFFFGGMALGAVIVRRGWRFWREIRWWAVVVAVGLGVLGVYLKIRPPQRASFYLSVWTVRMWHYWLTPLPYGGWLDMIVRNLGGLAALIAAVGALRAPKPAQGLLGGWLVGYLAYGFLVPVQIATHSYYHLPMVPWVALGLGLAAAQLAPGVRTWPRVARWLGAGLAALAIAYPVGITFWEMHSHDYRDQVAMYVEIGQQLQGKKVVALTEAYGWPLLYHGGVTTIDWPSDRQQLLFDKQGQFADLFRVLVLEKEPDYFLVTNWEEFARQGDLRLYLYTHYPVYRETERYLIFDLHQEKAPCSAP